jgi:DNA polymerase-3 subunit delta
MVALKTSDIDSFVARPDPARAVVLVFGPDAGLVSERVDAIIRASVDDTDDPFALVRLDGDALASDPARLIDEATTIPLFGGRRAIRVRAGSRNIVPAVEGVLSARLSDCRVVIEAGDLKRGAALRNVVERAKTAVAIPCYADAERDLGRLIDEELRAANLSIAPDARAALVPLLGGDRRASRAELRKLTLYAYGRERIEIDDVMAVVADASALALDSLIDAAFAGRLADVEKEFAKTSIAGTNPTTIVGAALRQIERLHTLRLTVESGTSVSATVEQMQPPIHFRRKTLIEAALKAWTSERLARAMSMLAQASLDARKQSDLGETIAHRALMLIARGAGARRES